MNVHYTLDQLSEAADLYLATQQAAKRSALMLHEGLEAIEEKALAAHVKAIHNEQDALANSIIAEHGLN